MYDTKHLSTYSTLALYLYILIPRYTQNYTLFLSLCSPPLDGTKNKKTKTNAGEKHCTLSKYRKRSFGRSGEMEQALDYSFTVQCSEQKPTDKSSNLKTKIFL